MILHGAPLFFGRVAQALHWVSRHTGIPVVLVTAAALVVSYRVAKKTARLVIEIVVVAVLLVVATKLGWIHF